MIIQKWYFSIFGLLLLLTILSGCETVAKFDKVAQGIIAQKVQYYLAALIRLQALLTQLQQ